MPVTDTGQGTDLTRLAPDPDALPPPAERTFPQHPAARGTAGYLELGDTVTGTGVRKRGQVAHSSPARLQQYQRPARQPGFPEEGAGLPLFRDSGLSVTFSIFPIH